MPCAPACGFWVGAHSSTRPSSWTSAVQFIGSMQACARNGTSNTRSIAAVDKLGAHMETLFKALGASSVGPFRDLSGTPLQDEDYLVLSTVHSAKGMEWDTVYVLNVVDGSFPNEFAAKPEQIDELLEFLADNHLGWSAAMAPAIMGNADRPELSSRLENSFCSTDPEIARDFARVTFLSDNRGDLLSVTARTLVLQCSDDIIAPREVGEYVHAQLPRSEFRLLSATGHCPNLSAPEEVTAAIREFV